MIKAIVVALLLAAAPLKDDARVAWLAKHAVPVRTLDPAGDDFRDLEPLRASLKGVRVVMLGEQTHGDGATFLGKTRLIRFLHERMGYDVLAFESGLYDCAKAWELMAAGEEPRKAMARGVFAIWMRTRELQPLADYLGAQLRAGHPLELAGVDSQLTASASQEFLVHDLAAALPAEFAKGDDWDRVVHVIDALNKSAWEEGTEPIPPAEEQEKFARTIERWRGAVKSAFWRQFLESLRVDAEQEWRTDYRDVGGNPAVFAMRDRQMGRNLLWLANERYPKRKIIVWAATFHNARGLGTIDTGNAKTAKLYAVIVPMGEVAWRELGDQLYSIGFTAYEGEFGTANAKNQHAVPAPSRGSIEDLFARAGFENAFLDLRRAPAWLRAPIAGQIFAHQEMRADWTRVVDGVVFVRKMEPSHKP